MIKLSEREEKVIYKIVADIMNHNIFNGTYDAKRGNKHFMYGISTMLEFLTNYTKNDAFIEYIQDEFLNNMIKSEKKVDKENEICYNDYTIKKER